MVTNINLMTDIVYRACEFATIAHFGQKRKFSGADYIVHPAAVVQLLKEQGFSSDENLLAAAWLHDVIEDCQVTYEDLVEMFNVDVADIVDEVSHPNASGNRATRWKSYLKYYDGSSDRGKILKMADRICNLQDFVRDIDMMSNSDKSFVRNIYLNESAELHKTIKDANFALANIFQNEIDNIFFEFNK